MMAIPEKQRLLDISYIQEKAKSFGFFACGISKAEHLEDDEQRVETWLEKGMHADMLWMENNKEKRYDPTKLVDGAQSVITVSVSLCYKGKAAGRKQL